MNGAMLGANAKTRQKIRFVRTILDERIPETICRLLMIVILLVLASFGTILW